METIPAALAGACVIAVAWAWWLSWSARWKAVFDAALKAAYPSPIVRLAHLQLWSLEKWPRERIERELEVRTGLAFPQW
jgi:hypothetical protein